MVRTGDDQFAQGWPAHAHQAKWSIRADREEQFATDFEAYARLESAGTGFDYTLITNEFDPARLSAAVEKRIAHTTLFTSVVHVNPMGVRAVYNHNPTPSSPAVVKAMEQGRLIGLGEWLNQLLA